MVTPCTQTDNHRQLLMHKHTKQSKHNHLQLTGQQSSANMREEPMRHMRFDSQINREIGISRTIPRNTTEAVIAAQKTQPVR
jgi:hypothetical protein